MLIRLFALLAVFALLAFAGAPALAADDTHEGKVVKVEAGKLTMTDKAGKEHSHTISKDVKITVDGKEAKLEDLKPGQQITVTMNKKDVTKVEVKK